MEGDYVLTGVVACLIMAIIFAVTGLVFAIGKEKAAILVSGFNSLSKEEQQSYDTARISKDMRNQCWTWAVVLTCGAFLTYYVSSFMSVVAMVVWLCLFFKEVHLDAYTAFEKYLK
ncbi:MAG: DUF3784 domain-containing protein [Bulleidia sp.]|nr:DUF3784 domain-containing protein [Bulleidia sp.]